MGGAPRGAGGPRRRHRRTGLRLRRRRRGWRGGEAQAGAPGLREGKPVPVRRRPRPQRRRATWSSWTSRTTSAATLASTSRACSRATTSGRRGGFAPGTSGLSSSPSLC
ncbi:hypothetical protein DAI22_01g228300 [Oryza sativa Japonica Group]|nr:hypothetical protein DAI22_01g228300 [Oryza sativa Japonica Group]